MTTPKPDTHSAPQDKPLVEVVPLGKVRAIAVEVAAAHLQAVFELPAQVLAPWPEPGHALLPDRGQYDAGPILLNLAQGADPPPLRLGLMAQDLCLPFLTYVFGEAQLQGRSAVVSLYRLQGEGPADRPGNPLFLERVAKLALHEIAHVMGLVHCQASGCLMNYSAGLVDLDRLKMNLCESCHRHFSQSRLNLIARAAQTQA